MSGTRSSLHMAPQSIAVAQQVSLTKQFLSPGLTLIQPPGFGVIVGYSGLVGGFTVAAGNLSNMGIQIVDGLNRIIAVGSYIFDNTAGAGAASAPAAMVLGPISDLQIPFDQGLFLLTTRLGTGSSFPSNGHLDVNVYYRIR